MTETENSMTGRTKVTRSLNEQIGGEELDYGGQWSVSDLLDQTVHHDDTPAGDPLCPTCNPPHREDPMTNEQITTAEQLDALPPGAVVLDAVGDPWVKDGVGGWWCYGQDNSSPIVVRDYGPLRLVHPTPALDAEGEVHRLVNTYGATGVGMLLLAHDDVTDVGRFTRGLAERWAETNSAPETTEPEPVEPDHSMCARLEHRPENAHTPWALVTPSGDEIYDFSDFSARSHGFAIPEPEPCPEWPFSFRSDDDGKAEVMIPAWGLKDGDMLSTPDGWQEVTVESVDSFSVYYFIGGERGSFSARVPLVVRRG